MSVITSNNLETWLAAEGITTSVGPQLFGRDDAGSTLRRGSDPSCGGCGPVAVGGAKAGERIGHRALFRSAETAQAEIDRSEGLRSCFGRGATSGK